MPITAQSPPATVPALERITQNIVESLQTITVANGYSVDAIVQRPNPGVGDDPEDGLLIVVVGGAVIEEPPQMFLQWLQTFHILGVVRLSTNAAETNIDTLRIKRASEVVWCLTHDRDGNRDETTRGGLAQDTKVIGTVMVDPEPECRAGTFIVDVTVQYRTPRNNPFASSSDD